MAANLDTTGKIIELEEEGDEFGGLGATGHMFDMLQKSVSSYSKLVFYIIYLYIILLLLLSSYFYFVIYEQIYS